MCRGSAKPRPQLGSFSGFRASLLKPQPLALDEGLVGVEVIDSEPPPSLDL